MKKLFALFAIIILCFALTSVHGGEPLNQGHATPTDLYVYATQTDLYSCATPTDIYFYSPDDVVLYVEPDIYMESVIAEEPAEEHVANFEHEDAASDCQQLPSAVNNKNKKTYTIQMLDSNMTPITDPVFIGAIEDDGIIIWLDEFCIYVAITPTK